MQNNMKRAHLTLFELFFWPVVENDPKGQDTYKNFRDAGSCPTRKLSDKTQPNDTQNCRTISLSNTFRVEHFPPSQIFITIDAQHHEEFYF